MYMHSYTCSKPLFSLSYACTIVSAEVIDEVEALRQSDIERAAYQPEPVAGLESFCYPQLHT